MTLVECTECGHEVSQYAQSCPNCGNPSSTPVPPEVPSPAAVGGPTAALVLGLVGGLLGLAISTIVLVGGLLTEDSTLAVLAAVAVGLSIMGIIGGAIAGANPRVATILLLVSGIGGFVAASLFWLIPGVLFTIGGVMAWRASRASRA